MISKYTMALLFLSLILPGCKDEQREKQLVDRENALAEREKTFAIKEADYQSLIRMRDSLATVRDTVILKTWPISVDGLWNARLVCRESSCTEYVVGDVRSDNWEFASDSTNIFTRVYNKEKLVRIYSANLSGSTIELQFATDSTSQKKVNINVRMDTTGTATLKGEQIVVIDDKCRAKFSVELTRSKIQ